MASGVRIVSGADVGLSDGMYEELNDGCYRRLPTHSASGSSKGRLGWAWNPSSKMRDKIYKIRGIT